MPYRSPTQLTSSFSTTTDNMVHADVPDDPTAYKRQEYWYGGGFKDNFIGVRTKSYA